MMYSIVLFAIWLMLFSLETSLACDAIIGEVIVFERKNKLPFIGDVGHVGVAFRNNDGTWTAGSIENMERKFFIIPGDFNGGWAYIFPSKEDVYYEFATNRSISCDNIVPHSAYDKMKIIDVLVSNAIAASRVINGFKSRGYNFINNNCLTGTDKVLKAYGITNLPKSHSAIEYFDRLPGTKLLVDHDVPLSALPDFFDCDQTKTSKTL